MHLPLPTDLQIPHDRLCLRTHLHSRTSQSAIHPSCMICHLSIPSHDVFDRQAQCNRQRTLQVAAN